MRQRLIGSICIGLIGALGLSAVLQAARGDSPVADAAMRGDRDGARSLLRQGGDANAAQGDGMTALHWAALKGDAELVQILLSASADVKAATRLGAYTPLFMAARSGHAAVIETLLDAGADPKATTTSGATPLMVAAASGSVDAVNRLLDRGSEVNAKESARAETALMFASAYGRSAVIKALMARGADPALTTRMVDLAAAAAKARQRQQGQRGAPAAEDELEAAPPPTETAEAPTGRARSQREGAADGAKQESTEEGQGQEKEEKEERPGIDRPYEYSELVGAHGGMTALLLAARQGHVDAVRTLIEAGADVNQVSDGDGTSPLLIAVINGHFDLAVMVLDYGADLMLASDNGVTPLYAALNVQWAPKALYPQPRAHLQQTLTYLDLMKVLLDKGADPHVRLKRKVWYSGYNFDRSGVNETGATPFWRAAYASDVDAMRLLVAHGADPNVPTVRPPGRVRGGDVSGKPPIPVGGPAVMPLQAAAGVGYGQGYAGNTHRNVPGGWMRAVKYLVEELGADVNAQDHQGYTALHHAAARGDNEMILFLVSKGADVTAVSRSGQTTADMANGPVQRISPFPETVTLLMKLGSKNNNRCLSC